MSALPTLNDGFVHEVRGTSSWCINDKLRTYLFRRSVYVLNQNAMSVTIITRKCYQKHSDVFYRIFLLFIDPKYTCIIVLVRRYLRWTFAWKYWSGDIATWYGRKNRKKIDIFLRVFSFPISSPRSTRTRVCGPSVSSKSKTLKTNSERGLPDYYRTRVVIVVVSLA